jgi:hypothetical protein
VYSGRWVHIAYSLHFGVNSTLRMEAVCPLIRCYLPIGLYEVVTQKTTIRIFLAVKTSTLIPSWIALYVYITPHNVESLLLNSQIANGFIYPISLLERYRKEHILKCTLNWGTYFDYCVYSLFLVLFKVGTAVTMKNTIFWNVKPCSPVEVYRRFGGTCCFHLQGIRISHVSN